MLYAGIWLNSLSVFLSAAFGFNLQQTIIVTGLVVLIMAVVGGSWAVLAGDFVQMLIRMPAAIVIKGDKSPTPRHSVSRISNFVLWYSCPKGKVDHRGLARATDRAGDAVRQHGRGQAVRLAGFGGLPSLEGARKGMA